MATVDELLGAPSVDDLLGPEPQAQFTRPLSVPVDPEKHTMQDEMTDASSVGRILDALGQGRADGWGAGEPSFSEETSKALTKAGIYNDYVAGRTSIIKTMNEALLRPVVSGLDFAFRSARAAVYSGARGAGQAAYEAGIAETPGRATRDLVALADTIMTVGGAAPIGIVPRVGRATSVDAGLPIDKVAQIGDGSLSPWLTADGRIVPTGGDHLSYIKEGSYSDHMRATGDIRASFFLKDDGLLGITLHAAEGQELTPKQMGTLSQIVSLRNGDVQIAFGRADGLVNPVYQKTEFSDLPVRAQTTTEGIPPIARTASEPLPKGSAIDAATGKVDTGAVRSADDMSLLLDDAVASAPVRQDLTRKVMSIDATREAAAALGVTEKELAKRNIGDAYNAERSFASVGAAKQFAEDFAARGEKVRLGTATEDDMLQFFAAQERMVLLGDQVLGFKAESGRALRILQEVKEPAKRIEAMAELVAKYGGPENVRLLAEKMALLDTSEGVAAFAREMRGKPTLLDKAAEAWRMWLVSGLKSQVANVASNIGVAVAAPVETTYAATIGIARKAVGISSEDRVLFGEATAQVAGMLHGMRDGASGFWQVMRTGEPSAMAHNFQDAARFNKAIGGVTGDIVRLPGRSMAAFDEFFRGMAYHSQIYQDAYRTVVKEGRPFSDIVDLRANPTDAMMKRAVENADYRTFQKKLGRLGQSAQAFIGEHPTLSLAVPFIRTPVNIGKYSGERSPVAFLSKSIREDLSGANGQVAQDTALAKMMFGTTIATTALALAIEGNFTGGGAADPNERAMEYLEGKRPYSVKINGYYYPIRRYTEPFGTIAGVAADLVAVGAAAKKGEIEQVGILLSLSAARNVLNMSSAKGMSDILKVMNEPKRYGDTYVQNLVATMAVPKIVEGTLGRDEYLREARTILDAIKARVTPKEVVPRRDIFGQWIRRDSSLGPDLISPLAYSEASKDPVVAAMARLQVFPAKPDRKIDGVELTPAQYGDLQFNIGSQMRVLTDQVVNTPGYATLPTGAQREMLVDAIEAARASGMAQTKAEHPDLWSAILNKKLEKVTAP